MARNTEFVGNRIASDVKVITNLFANVRIHSLSQFFKRWTKVRVKVPAPLHYIIPEKKRFYVIFQEYCAL